MREFLFWSTAVALWVGAAIASVMIWMQPGVLWPLKLMASVAFFMAASGLSTELPDWVAEGWETLKERWRGDDYDPDDDGQPIFVDTDIKVELQPAYHWHCEHCSASNFVQPQRKEMTDDEAKAAYREYAELDEWSPLPEDWRDMAFVRFPYFVACDECGAVFGTRDEEHV